MSKILIVDDSTETFELVRRALGNSLQIEWAKTVGEASRALESRTYDLILLDVTLPDGDGYRLCSLLRTDTMLKNTSVIFLTGRNSLADKIMGFSVGADDFVTKPFDGVELRARVEAKLRRRDRDKAQDRVLKAGDLEINKDTQKVSYQSADGDTVDLELTPIEFKILLYLANRINHVRSRSDLLAAVWGENVYVYSRSVDTHVSKLRKKLGENAKYIQSVHGSGYRFTLAEGRDVKKPMAFASEGLATGL